MFLVGPARLFNISHKDQEYADFSIEVLLLVEKMVAIWKCWFLKSFFHEQLRLMKDNEKGDNKGFAFITFTSKEDAEKAIETLNGRELKVSYD